MLAQKKGVPLPPSHWLFAVVLVSGLAFTAGLFASEVEAADNRTYQVTSKSETIPAAHILRTSSNGFIISVNGIVQFIPQAEIKLIKANEKME